MGIIAGVSCTRVFNRWIFSGGLSFVRAVLGALSIGAGTLLRGGAKARRLLPAPLSPARGTVFTLGLTHHPGALSGKIRRLHGSAIFFRKICGDGEAQAGFVLVNAVAFIPMIVTVVMLAAGAQYVFKRKLRAQAMCVKEGLLLQRDLQKTLKALVQLNPQATRLRMQRTNADRAVLNAIASANPYALAAAKAAQTAVILAQIALKAQQMKLLAQAGLQRQDHHRALSVEVRRMPAAAVQSKTFYLRPLAVEPKPPTSLTPDYKMVPTFETSQQHQFSFDVILSPPFLNLDFKQKTLCSVTLNGKENSWLPQIAAASALSKRR